ncbi:DUF3175 domain-containing protein [Pedobacter antarcticus]|uniref:DUF3175 domain-containing protein n=1 Tax=Pedobacter antarcticus TaxID=34086 RepID=UPI001C567038|nr:DUF3175 domain-containing protein [Pedobacter antarcticus]
MATQKDKKGDKTKTEKWSAEVTKNSDALDLKENIFESKSAKKIAESLKKSAEQSDRKKSGPYRSAMSMLTFYINRAGKNLEAEQKQVLEEAKDELRKAFGREPRKKSAETGKKKQN